MRAALRPAGQPSIEPPQPKPGEPLEYVATFEVYPEIQALDVSDLAIDRPNAEVTDADVEEMLGTLRELGLEEDTLVIFTNDNGPVLEEMSKPYRGTKNTTFEGGVRVPFLARFPGRIPAGRVGRRRPPGGWFVFGRSRPGAQLLISSVSISRQSDGRQSRQSFPPRMRRSRHSF